jgi:hypothetical protein
LRQVSSPEGRFVEAAWKCHSELAGALLKDQGDRNLDLPGEDGRTPLEIAAMSGHVDIVGQLLGAGAETNVVDKGGCPLL